MLGWFPFPRAATIGADISLTGILGRRTLPCLTAGVVLLRTVEARPWEHSQASLLSVAALFSLTFSSARLLQENRLARRLALSSLSTLSFLALAVCLRNWQLAFPERNWSAGANLPGGESLFVSILLCELAGLLTALAGIRLLTPSAESDFAETLAGAATQRPGAAALCGLGLLSLAGMPPLPGFWWRLGLLLALGLPHRQSTLTGLIETDNLMTCLTICLGVLLVVSALGRLRLLRQLAFEDPFRLRCEHAGLSLRIAAGLAVLLLLAAGLVPLSLNDAILPAIPKAAP
jgi:NADH:ubiquinone oxidoreductase subunit 2 (subunit N)